MTDMPAITRPHVLANFLGSSDADGAQLIPDELRRPVNLDALTLIDEWGPEKIVCVSDQKKILAVETDLRVLRGQHPRSLICERA